MVALFYVYGYGENQELSNAQTRFVINTKSFWEMMEHLCLSTTKINKIYSSCNLATFKIVLKVNTQVF